MMMRGLLILTIFWSFSLSSAQEAPLLKQGFEAFQAQDWEKAKNSFEAFGLQEGYSAPLLLNLAQVYLKTGQIPQAEAAFFTKLALDPADGQTTKDLSQLIGSIIELSVQPQEVKKFLFGESFYRVVIVSAGTASLVGNGSALLGGLLCLGLSLARLWRQALLILVVGGGASFLCHAYSFQMLKEARVGVVKEEQAQLLTGPRDSESAITALKKGLPIKIHEEQEHYVRGVTWSGQEGWIAKSNLSRF